MPEEIPGFKSELPQENGPALPSATGSDRSNSGSMQCWSVTKARSHPPTLQLDIGGGWVAMRVSWHGHGTAKTCSKPARPLTPTGPSAAHAEAMQSVELTGADADHLRWRENFPFWGVHIAALIGAVT